MTLENPLWQQANTYSARVDRQLVGSLFDGGVVGTSGGGLAVTERGAGANFTVDVAAGTCVVPGTSIANQGSYLCVSTATENVTVPAAPGSNSRIDLVVAQVYDSQVSGVLDEWAIEIVEGTAAGSPVAPAVPDDAITLAQILVASTDASVTDSMITDVRTEAEKAVPAAGGTFTGPVEFEQVPTADGDDVARIAAGTYTGDGTNPRTITLGFTPKVVFLSRDDTSPGVFFVSHLPSGTTGINLGGQAEAEEAYSASADIERPGLTTNGFIVGGSGTRTTNASAVTYQYLALS